MAKTKEELINRALQEIGVLQAGQSASAEDAKTVGDEIGPMLSQLSSREVYHFGDPDDIEDATFIPLAIIIGNSLARTFGLDPDKTEILLAERQLRDINHKEAIGAPLQVEYF